MQGCGPACSPWCCSAPAASSTGRAAQPGCSPPATNTSCATSTLLTVNATCINGTTCQGGAQSASTCLYAGSQCVWYRFTATATSMYVNIDVTATDGCHISSNVYRATGPCTGFTQVSCLAGAPLDDAHILTGLTVGSLYYVQVCYSPGGPCGNNGSAEFCIEVGTPDPPCNTCSTPCGAALGYSTTPSIAQVVADCTTDPFGPPLQPGSTSTFCNTFTATATSVAFNVIITSDCGMGNVTAFTWSLYNSPACGGAIQTGTIANLNFTGLTIGNSYVFCYTFTVPATCTHTQHCPYFVGATTPLPVTWLYLEAEAQPDRTVEVLWATATERGNDHFTVERSVDAEVFEDIGEVPGAGNSTEERRYRFIDQQPYTGTSYYRVRQTDLNGDQDRSNTASVRLAGAVADMTVWPNPATEQLVVGFSAPGAMEVRVELVDACGRLLSATRHLVSTGANTVQLSCAQLPPGVYAVSIGSPQGRRTLRFVKE